MRAKGIMRFSVISLTTLVALHAVACAAKPEAARFAYVADAANKINYLKAISVSPKDHSEEIASVACEMLIRLLADTEFSGIVHKWPGGMTDEQKAELLSLGMINDKIDKEKQALENIGIDQLTTIQVLAAAIPFAKSIEPKHFNPDDFLKDLTSLQKKSFSLKGEIADNEKWEKKKQAVVLGIYGVAFLLADGASEYFSWGLSSVVVSFSFPAGGNMVAAAWPNL
jgi:hypothetical protein